MTEDRTPLRRARAIAATRVGGGTRSLTPLPLHRLCPLPERRADRRARAMDMDAVRWLERIDLPALGALRLGIPRGLQAQGAVRERAFRDH